METALSVKFLPCEHEAMTYLKKKKPGTHEFIILVQEKQIISGLGGQPSHLFDKVFGQRQILPLKPQEQQLMLAGWPP